MRDPGFAPAGPETRREHLHPGDYSSRSDQLTHGQHQGLAKYIYVFIALCVLTGCSFFTQSAYWPFHDTPRVGWAFMMAVSCTKALLVVLFFMHVKYEAGWKYALTLPAGFMAVFLTLMLVPDIGMRNQSASSESRYYSADPPGAHPQAPAVELAPKALEAGEAPPPQAAP
jgi:cytochrome c oxidase subunit 4